MPILLPLAVGIALGVAAHRNGRPAAVAAVAVAGAVAWGVGVNARTYHDAPLWMVIVAGSLVALVAELVGGIVGFASSALVSRAGRRTRHPSR